jgi:hypothetical protein
MNDNSNGHNGNGACKTDGKQKLPRTAWKPGQSGNPRGRPRKGECLSDIIRETLAGKPPGERRTYREIIARRLAHIAAFGDGDDDATRAAREIRQATEGDKLQVNSDWKPDEWEKPDPADAEPIPAVRWSDKVP